MITKFTFPTEGRTHLQSVGKLTNHFRIEPKQMAERMLFWGDLYTIIYNFLSADIENFEEAKKYFVDSIDFEVLTEYTNSKGKKHINIANSFYFYFD